MRATTKQSGGRSLISAERSDHAIEWWFTDRFIVPETRCAHLLKSTGVEPDWAGIFFHGGNYLWTSGHLDKAHASLHSGKGIHHN